MVDKKIIAVDFDGTLCTHLYPEIGVIGGSQQFVIDMVRDLYKKGHIIILWTCRTDCASRQYLTEAVEWCKVNNIPLTYVNEHPEYEDQWLPRISRKLYADFYIDDKSIIFEKDCTIRLNKLIVED